MQLRIAVTNLQSGIGMTKGYAQYLTRGWKYVFPHTGKGLKGAADFLQEAHIDIALATEVEESSRRSGFHSQLERIQKESGMEYAHFFPVHTRGHAINEGNAIFSKFPIIETAIHYLSARVTPRALGKAVITVNETNITVFVAHLALRRRMRETQLHEIARIVKRTKGPYLLGGDFNARDHRELEFLRNAGLKHFCALANFPSWKPKYALQVLFLSEHFDIEKHYIPKNVNFSDHLPLVVEVTLRG